MTIGATVDALERFKDLVHPVVRVIRAMIIARISRTVRGEAQETVPLGL